MIATVLLAALSAAPVEVVSFDAPDGYALARFKKAAGNRTVIDASGLFRALLGPTDGVIPIRDFSKFAAPPPPSWPRSLDPLWTASLTQCHERVGDDWRSTATQGAAMACGNRLGAFLWQRYVTELKATRVVVYDAWVDDKKNKAGATAIASSPEGATELWITREGTAGQLRALEDDVLQDLAANAGETRPHEVIRELFSASAIDPYAGAAEVKQPMTPKKACSALPASLDVTPPSRVGASVMARWPVSVKGSGAPLSCTLSYDEHQESGGIMPMTVVTGTLRCGATVVAVEGAKETIGPRSPVEMMSGRLIDALTARLCQ